MFRNLEWKPELMSIWQSKDRSYNFIRVYKVDNECVYYEGLPGGTILEGIAGIDCFQSSYRIAPQDEIPAGFTQVGQHEPTWRERVIEKQKRDTSVTCPECGHNFMNPMVKAYNNDR